VTTIDLDELERLAKVGEPLYKYVDCPTCDSRVGQMCGGISIGGLHWTAAAPHAARKRAADNLILSLIARLKRAERTLRDREPPHCATCDCEVPNG
jgi:hypothetical protein